MSPLGVSLNGLVVDTVRGSELDEKVFSPIFELRNPNARKDYEKELAIYLKRLGKKEEVERETSDGPFFRSRRTGFVQKVFDQEVFIPRPQRPGYLSYGYQEYERSFGFTLHAKNHGLLADSLFNREIRIKLVEAYGEAMEKGQWHDLLSDPITITRDGQVINGQHRLAAASRVNWEEAPNDPLFMVVWGVAPEEAAFTDGSKRTDKEQAVIATKLLADRS